jgi:uncharacterized protein YggE
MVFQGELRARLVGALLLLCLPGIGVSQQTSTPSARTVRASADATVTAKPDEALISFSVSTQASTAEQASQQNAGTTAGAISAVKQAVGSKGRLETSGFFTTPLMQYPKNGGTPKITGYSASNRLTVTLDDLALVSKVIDTAISAGATQVQDVRFSLKHDDTIRTQALAEASQKAYESAEAIAKALKLNVVGVLNAQTVSEEPRPFPMLASTAQTVEIQGVTPIEPSNVQVHVTVAVTLEVR